MGHQTDRSWQVALVLRTPFLGSTNLPSKCYVYPFPYPDSDYFLLDKWARRKHVHAALYSSGRSATSVSTIYRSPVPPHSPPHHTAHLKWVTEELDAALDVVPAGLEVVLQVYVTSDGPIDTDPTHSLDDDTSSSTDPEKDAYSDIKAPPTPSTIAQGIELRSGRPDVAAILEDAVAKSAGPVSVDGMFVYTAFAHVVDRECVVSGPHALTVAIRKALSSPFAGPAAVLRGAPTVQLNVEDFSM